MPMKMSALDEEYVHNPVKSEQGRGNHRVAEAV